VSNLRFLLFNPALADNQAQTADRDDPETQKQLPFSQGLIELLPPWLVSRMFLFIQTVGWTHPEIQYIADRPERFQRILS
jgi:hypothetical protein